MDNRCPYPVLHAVAGREHCRNTHTLTPLFAGSNGVPVPVTSIPRKFFWRNSDGYGFDVRTLSVLLRQNCRNVNPHTVTSEGPTSPLWCNAADITSLLSHANLNPEVRQKIMARVRVLNQLSIETKTRLATAAGELYSASFQGFCDWLWASDDLPDVLRALGIRSSRKELTDEAVRCHSSRRASDECFAPMQEGISSSPR